MPTLTKIRRMTGKAGVQTFNVGSGYTVTGVTVNGSAATGALANGVYTISSPTLAGGEAIVATETLTTPSVGAMPTMPVVATTSVTLARTKGGVLDSAVVSVVSDEQGTIPAFTVTGTTKTNH